MMTPYVPLRRHERAALAIASATSALAVIGAVLLLFEYGARDPRISQPEALAAAERAAATACPPEEMGGACAPALSTHATEAR